MMGSTSVLFTDRFQKRVEIQEKVKVKVNRKPRFEDIQMFSFKSMLDIDDDYDIRIKTRHLTLGTDLSTLEAEIDSGKF